MAFPPSTDLFLSIRRGRDASTVTTMKKADAVAYCTSKLAHRPPPPLRPLQRRCANEAWER
jgi:hypothetical protein